MSFGYLAHYDHYLPATTDDDDQGPSTAYHPPPGIQFSLPHYLFDAPPTLAPGGGAEAFHPAQAQAATWFTNSGFRPPASQGYDSYQDVPTTSWGPAVQNALFNAHASLESLAGAFPAFLASASASASTSTLITPNSSAGTTPTIPSPTPQLHLQIPAINASPPPNTPAPVTGIHTPDSSVQPECTPLGLPMYSQSGFDVITLLSRVINRPNPVVQLGPLDMSTSFVVVDCRRHDDPIIHCSPNFCALTGYAEREVQGRNCRFLQAPPAVATAGRLALEKGDQRRHTSLGAVRALAKAVVGRKEAQVSVVNYRKDGEAFVNLVSVVPIIDEDGRDGGVKGEVVWFVGFQVDLTKQSEGIAKRVREGRYYAAAVLQHKQAAVQDKKKEDAGRERRAASALPAPPKMSQDLARLLGRTPFLTSCGVSAPSAPGAGIHPDPTSHVVHSLLLGSLPDFVHVLSLKGAFLYVSPAVTRVLGWAPSDLVGRGISDLCFDRDVVSVGRALKEASLPLSASEPGSEKDKDNGKSNGHVISPLTPEALRVVELVFRARTKQGAWVWVECRGRLHIEPGKGRKAIVMIGRARGMASVSSTVPTESFVPPLRTPPRASPLYSTSRSPTGSASGLEFALQPQAPKPRRSVDSIMPIASSSRSADLRTSTSATVPIAFHGLVDPFGLLLSVGAGCSTILDCEPVTLRGTRLAALVAPDSSGANPVDALFASWRADRPSAAREVYVTLRCSGKVVPAIVRIVAPTVPTMQTLPPLVMPAHLMYSVRLATSTSGPGPGPPTDRFARLDPASGSESWQYEISQLKFANERLIDEIRELERVEALVKEKEAREQERERDRLLAYSNPIHTQQYVPSHYQDAQWDYPAAGASLAYHLPMKRPWDRRDEV